MSKMHTCTIDFSEDRDRFEATFNGQLVAFTKNRNGAAALKGLIESGMCQRAIKMKVSKAQIISISADDIDGEEGTENPTIETVFDINERFDFLQSYVSMVANDHLASALIAGRGGMGKSFTVLQTLHENGIPNLSSEIGGIHTGKRGFHVVKGYSTPRALFRTLYESRHRGQITVYDDCDSILKDPNAINVLKAALDSYEERIICWNAESSANDDLPRSFKFEGSIIFITNRPMHKLPPEIRSRAVCADVSMNREEVVSRMETIIQSEEFMPDVLMSVKIEVVGYIRENLENSMIREFNLRSLVNGIKIRNANPTNWKRVALYDWASS